MSTVTDNSWARHVIDPAHNVAASWSGEPDGVSGFTFKYSNSFEVTIKSSDIQTGNLVCLVDGANVRLDPFTYTTSVGITAYDYNQPVQYLYQPNPVNHPGFREDIEIRDGEAGAAQFQFTFIKLPYIDLPGIIVVTILGGYAHALHFNTSKFAIPVFDPNWKPSTVNMVNQVTSLGFVRAQSSYANANYMVTQASLYAPLYLNSFDQVNAYRFSGGGATVTCTAAEIVKNGTFAAARVPLTHTEPYEGYVYGAKPTQIRAVDMPLDYEGVTSLPGYKKFDIKAGVYAVHSNDNPVNSFIPVTDRAEIEQLNVRFDQIGTEINQQSGTTVTFNAEDAMIDPNRSSSYFIVLQNGNTFEKLPVFYLKTWSQHALFTNAKSTQVPVYSFSLNPISNDGWNALVISSNVVNSTNSAIKDSAAIYNFRLYTYAELRLGNGSTWKVTASQAAKYQPRIIEMVRMYQHSHEGIYPGYMNDAATVWNNFKSIGDKYLEPFVKSSTVNKINRAQLVSLTQSVVQRLANKDGMPADSRLSKEDKAELRKFLTANQVTRTRKSKKNRKKRAAVAANPPQ